MSMNVSSDAPVDPVVIAAKRLDGAMSRIEALTVQLRSRAEKAASSSEDARNFDDDRARLAQALDAARGREEVLQVAAQEASEALDRAIEDLRLAVDED